MADAVLLLSVGLIGMVLLFALAIRYHNDKLAKLEEQVEWANAERRKAQAAPPVKNAWNEQWAPLLSGYPYDPQRFRFIGSPVEGVQFEPDRIVFLSLGFGPKQDAARVRELIQMGRVEFYEASGFGGDVPSRDPPV